MLQLHSKKPEGRWRDQGSRHRSISSQVWLVECPWPQLLSVEEYWRSFQSFPFTLLGTTLVFKRGRWSQRSPVLRRSAWSCWPSLLRFRDSLAITHAIKRKKPNHYITEAIKKKEELSIAASKLEVHSFKELCQFHFSCADSIRQWVGWRAQDGRWEEKMMSKSLRDTDEHTTYDFILAVCWLKLFFTWLHVGFIPEVWLLRLFAPRLAALWVVEIADALLVLLNLFDRACWTRPFVSACKEARVFQLMPGHVESVSLWKWLRFRWW